MGRRISRVSPASLETTHISAESSAERLKESDQRALTR
jgi:hypothetical protein